MPSGTATRFAGPAQVSNAASTKYTVASGQRIVLRHIHVQNPSGSPVTFTMSIGTDAAGTRIYDAYSLAANTPYDFFCYYPLAAAEIIQAFAGTTNVLTLTLNGDLYLVG